MENVHRLEGSSGGAGGLVIRKKASDTKELSSSSFKSPKTSMLGLDKLASIKKVQQVSYVELFLISKYLSKIFTYY